MGAGIRTGSHARVATTLSLTMTPQPSRLSIDRTTDTGFAVSGVIDSHTADDLSAALDAFGTTGDVTVDLRAVEFIDSSGLRAIVSAHQALDGAGHRLVLDGASEAVERLLDITGLSDHLHTS